MEKFVLSSLFFIASAYGMNLKLADLSYDLNNDTIHWPTGTAFQLFVRHKGIFQNDSINYLKLLLSFDYFRVGES